MQSSMFNVRVPLRELGRSEDVFLMNTFTDAQLVVGPEETRFHPRAQLGLQQELQQGGGVDDDHADSRSSR